MRKITVFCGSNWGSDKEFTKQAYLLGETLAKKDIQLIYGGARVGLMAEVANGALKNNGDVLGIIPGFLQNEELAHEGLSELIVVKTMHERKIMMSDLSDGFIAMPGGLGTLDELFEMLTWAQLSIHSKPIALLNTNGFYNDLVNFIQQTIDKGFVQQVNLDVLIVSDNIEDILKQMDNYNAPRTKKWKIL